MNKKRKICFINNMDEIIPNLYLGNKLAASDINNLKEHNITHIVNCAEELKYIIDEYDGKFICLHLPICDSGISGSIINYITEAIKFIDNALSNDKKVLVHCSAGISRSVSIVIAYMMYKNNLSFNMVYDHIKSIRPLSRLFTTFREELKSFKYLNI